MSNSLDPVMSSQILGPNCYQKLSADYTTSSFQNYISYKRDFFNIILYSQNSFRNPI